MVLPTPIRLRAPYHRGDGENTASGQRFTDCTGSEIPETVSVKRNEGVGNKVMGEESRKIELCLVGVGVVWVLSLALLVAESAAGADGDLSRWGFWLELVAVAWTVHILIMRAKRSMVRGVAREIAFANRDPEEVAEVRHLR